MIKQTLKVFCNEKMCSQFWWGNIKVEDYYEDVPTDGGII